MKRAYPTWSIAVLILILSVLILVGVVANMVTTLKLASGLSGAPPRSLPCAAVPTRLILEDPVCAQKLLDAMNVTNVRIQRGQTWEPDAGKAISVRREVSVAGGKP